MEKKSSVCVCMYICVCIYAYIYIYTREGRRQARKRKEKEDVEKKEKQRNVTNQVEKDWRSWARKPLTDEQTGGEKLKEEHVDKKELKEG